MNKKIIALMTSVLIFGSSIPVFAGTWKAPVKGDNCDKNIKS